MTLHIFFDCTLLCFLYVSYVGLTRAPKNNWGAVTVLGIRAKQVTGHSHAKLNTTLIIRIL